MEVNVLHMGVMIIMGNVPGHFSLYLQIRKGEFATVTPLFSDC